MGGAKAHYDGIVAFSQTDFTEDLRKITVPVLVMHGDDDQIVPYADSGPLSRVSRQPTMAGCYCVAVTLLSSLGTRDCVRVRAARQAVERCEPRGKVRAGAPWSGQSVVIGCRLAVAPETRFTAERSSAGSQQPC